jgi:predicted membrane metal-binding protein
MPILIYGRRPYLFIDGSSGAAKKTDSSKCANSKLALRVSLLSRNCGQKAANRNIRFTESTVFNKKTTRIQLNPRRFDGFNWSAGQTLKTFDQAAFLQQSCVHLPDLQHSPLQSLLSQHLPSLQQAAESAFRLVLADERAAEPVMERMLRKASMPRKFEFFMIVQDLS